MDLNASDTSSTATMDFDASADRIGSMLGEDVLGSHREPTERPGIEQPETPEPVAPPPVAPPVQTYEVPKSWKREMHDHWGKITPDAQAYIIEREKQLLDGFQTFRPIQDAITPHQEFLARAQKAPAQAVADLLHAQRQLVEGSPEQRWAAFQQLAKHLGWEQRLGQQQPTGQPDTPVDPQLQAVQQRLEAIEQQAQAQWRAQQEAIKAENMKIIEAFAADTKAHPYFDEVTEEIGILLKQGKSLQDAYPIAVRMNPTVWAKEEARLLTEAEAKWKETARLNSLPKKQAARVNIKSNGDGPEPTEPLGSIEDTIKAEHKKLRARA